MGRKKLTDEERAISREKRLQYLRDYRKEHGPEYYEKNKERILQQRRKKREEIKGAPLRKLTKGVNIKQMTREQYNAYCKEKVRESRARKKAEKIKIKIEGQEKEIELHCEPIKPNQYIMKINGEWCLVTESKKEE